MVINFDSTIELTQDQIFSTITDKEVYERYLGTSIDTLKKVKCCFHTDKNPSMGFYVASNKELKYKCFACGVQGNSINFVKDLFNINYPQALRRLQNDFNLTESSVPVIVKRIEQTTIHHRVSDTAIIPVLRPFTAVDFDYWIKYHITLDMLLDYDVSGCERVFLFKNGIHKLIRENNKLNPTYCYQINTRYKIYNPLDTTSNKWLNTTTSGDIQGMNQLPASGGLLFMTSSLKDVMCLKLLGYNAIALESEGAHIEPKIFDYLCACFKNIIIFYDNDGPGIKYAEKMGAKLCIDYIHIPTNHPEKDISDYIARYGLDKAKQLIIEILDKKYTY